MLDPFAPIDMHDGYASLWTIVVAPFWKHPIIAFMKRVVAYSLIDPIVVRVLSYHGYDGLLAKTIGYTLGLWCVVATLVVTQTNLICNLIQFESLSHCSIETTKLKSWLIIGLISIQVFNKMGTIYSDLKAEQKEKKDREERKATEQRIERRAEQDRQERRAAEQAAAQERRNAEQERRNAEQERRDRRAAEQAAAQDRKELKDTLALLANYNGDGRAVAEYKKQILAEHQSAIKADLLATLTSTLESSLEETMDKYQVPIPFDALTEQKKLDTQTSNPTLF